MHSVNVASSQMSIMDIFGKQIGSVKEDGLVNCCNAEEFYDELEACTARWEAMLRSIRE